MANKQISLIWSFIGINVGLYPEKFSFKPHVLTVLMGFLCCSSSSFESVISTEQLCHYIWNLLLLFVRHLFLLYIGRVVQFDYGISWITSFILVIQNGLTIDRSNAVFVLQLSRRLLSRMIWYFASPSTLLYSYRGDKGAIIDGSMHCSRISHKYSSLFIIVINLIFMFSLWCIDRFGAFMRTDIFMYFCIKGSIGTQDEVG